MNFVTAAPDANSVTLVDNGTTVVMSNGIVKATIAKSSARVTSLIYNGLEMLKGNNGAGNVYWSWNMAGNYNETTNCTYTLTANPNSNNFNYAEIKLHMAYNAAPTSAAMDVDVYYSLPKNASGLYASATLTHPANYPALPGGEWRMASVVNDRFDWLSVDSLRNRIMPPAADAANNVAVAGAPVEVSRYTTGIYANKYECKYDYSADYGDIDVWGWGSTTDNVGLWVTAPSKEYYPGGPKKRELMSHGQSILLNMIGGTHFGQGHETAVAAGEEWQKNYGPFLLYCNKVPGGTANAPIALWEDAKAQALTEQAKWPYEWSTNPTYIKESGRGTVTGKLVINDAANPTASVADSWVGLGIPPAGASSTTDFQDWSKNYQFWVKTDANGNFTIPHVLPGTYSLFAFGPGANGQLSLPGFATVSAGNTTTLGNVSWTPTRVAPTVWEIGTPDRNATEFKHGKDWWTSNTYPDPRWGIFLNYPDEFPNDVNFTIGQSDIATDWNFVHYWDKSARATSPAWKVNFDLATAPTSGSTASVYVALAENTGSALILSVNGTNVTSPATGVSLSNPSNAMLRKGIHGAFHEVRINFPASYLKAGANQISFTLRVTGSLTLGNVMYDYIRLEADVPACTIPTFTTTPESIITSARVTGCDTVVDYAVEASGIPAPAYTYTFTGATTASGAGTGSGNVFNKGTTNVIVTATNSCGTANYNFDVTVNDSTNPAIIAPDNVTVNTDDGICSASSVSLGTPVTSDNCIVQSVTNDAPASFPVVTTTVTWTVTDAHGNISIATQTVTVAKKDQTITFEAMSQKFVGDADFNPSATASSGLPVTLTSSNTAVATIENGLVHIVGAGTTEITASLTGNECYSAAAAVSQILTVQKITQTITFATLADKKTGDADFALIASVTSGLPIAYTSSNTAVATVINGMVHITGAGSTTITASQAGDDNYESAVPVNQVLLVSVATNLKVQHMDGDNGQKTNNSIRPYLKLVNEGTSAIPYSELTVRYWITAENYSGIGTAIDYAQIGINKMKMKYVSLDQPYNGANGYVEYGFEPTAGNLVAGGNSGVIQSRLNNTNYANLSEADDHSYYANNSYAVNNKITVYRNGQLVAGIEPASVAPVTALKVQSESKNNGSNSISTYLKISNEGNVPVEYKDISVKYWFTSEGTSPLNYWIDYAQLGNSKLTGQFVRLSPAMTNADAYFELKVNASAGNLYPLSNSGNIQYRIAKSDWSNFNQLNDHSYKPVAPFSDNEKIAVYYKGVLVYGTEPSGGGIAMRNAGDAIASEDLNTPIYLYPNPVISSLNIRVNKLEANASVEVYNSLGSLVHAQRMTNLTQNISMQKFTPGVYHVQVRNGAKLISKQIVKE